MLIIAKLLASVPLVTFFIAGALKANPRTHIQRPMAEYSAGFIICAVSVAGFYYLWLA